MTDHLKDKAHNAPAAEPSGPKDDTPTTANTGVRSATPENKAGKINPSAPGDTGTTPGSNAQ